MFVYHIVYIQNNKFILKHTHCHFTALLDLVRDYPGEPLPER